MNLETTVCWFRENFNWISEKYKQQLNGANPESKFLDFFEAVEEILPGARRHHCNKIKRT